MSTIRRIYLYLVSLISLGVLLAGVMNLARVLITLWLGGHSPYDIGTMAWARLTFARWSAVVLVALPVHLLHWTWAQRLASTSSEERAASLRKAYLYLAQAILLIVMVIFGGQLLQELLWIGLGAAPKARWPTQPVSWALNVAFSAIGLVYLRRVAYRDGDYGQEPGRAAYWRRLYFVLAALGGLIWLVFGTARLLQMILELWFPLEISPYNVDQDWWRAVFADSVTRMAVGLAIWWPARGSLSAWAEQSLVERQAALRKVYLYGAVILGAGITLGYTTWLLRLGLLAALGHHFPATNPLRLQVMRGLSYLPPGLLVWWAHWHQTQADARIAAETPEAATIRRLYFYLVAAVGLGLLWYGLTDLLRVGLELGLGTRSPFDVGGAWWRERVSLAVALMLVGGLTWWAHWVIVQSGARRPDESGIAERRSLVRKAYLYGSALVGAVLILFNLATAIYRILSLMLGEPVTGSFVAQVAEPLAIAAVAGFWWSFHVWAIREDGRQGEGARTEEEIAVRRARLEAELAAARQRVAELEQALRELEEESPGERA